MTVEAFEEAAGMDRRVLYRNRANHRITLMGLAYFFGMTVEELVAGTTAEAQWNRE